MLYELSSEATDVAQLVEHGTGNRKVTGSNPVEVLNFFQASLRNYINCVHYDDHFFIFKVKYNNKHTNLLNNLLFLFSMDLSSSR